ncbi:DinB family protein [Kribbella speibonae]|uniref:DinB family protein n=1 Tax=Kribbella speibonae TaxID=1572660 RepID=A0ABY2A803_9ACTN|nr:DinB family protein [Kribbella speibonae]TCC25108.1 DinB family protein [Kribbella speibonae]
MRRQHEAVAHKDSGCDLNPVDHAGTLCAATDRFRTVARGSARLTSVERVFPDGAADERGVLTGFLDWQRATVRRKVDGLPIELADRALMDTSPRMTIAGVVSHLRQTEYDWFAGSFPSLADEPFDRDPNGGWSPVNGAITDLLTAYEAECAQSRRIISQLTLDTIQHFTPPQFAPVSVRWILTHLIEETARHLGHLDILREHLDGTRGY